MLAHDCAYVHKRECECFDQHIMGLKYVYIETKRIHQSKTKQNETATNEKMRLK